MFAIEVLSATEIVGRHIKGLFSFKDEFAEARCIVVSLDKMERTTEPVVEILHAYSFRKQMRRGQLF